MSKKGTKTRTKEEFLRAFENDKGHVPASLPPTQIEELTPKQSFWDALLAHRRTVKLKKVETKTAMNYNGVIVLLGVALLVIGATAIVLLHTLQAGFYRASEDVATIISDHPGMALAAYSASQGNDDDTVLIAAMLSELSAQGKVHGSFNGHWTNNTEQVVVKNDPTCIDEYTYRTIPYNLSNEEYQQRILEAEDEGYERAHVDKAVWRCENDACEDATFPVSAGYTIYHRNEHTCPYEIRAVERPGEFIPDTITVIALDVGYQGIGQHTDS